MVVSHGLMTCAERGATEQTEVEEVKLSCDAVSDEYLG